MGAQRTLLVIHLQYLKLGRKEWSNWHSPKKATRMLGALGSHWFLRLAGDQQDEIRGGIGLLGCGRLPLSYQCITASPLSFIFSLILTLSHAEVQSPREISHPARSREGVVVCVCVWSCECVSEGKKECKRDEREQGGRENKIVFHPKAYNSALYLKIDAGLKKVHQSKHQKCAAVTGNASLCCTDTEVATRGRTENDKGIYKSLWA